MGDSPSAQAQFKAALVSAAAAAVVRGFGMTWRVELDDPHGYACPGAFPDPIIWVFWHNRVMGMPLVYRKFVSHRRAVVLTSPSRDGEVLARTMARFDLGAVRGSSSRRGARAMKELVLAMRAGSDVIITPDGPRGPKYQLQSGLVQLAALTGALVVPIVVEYSRFRVLRTWDAFRIPLPGATVRARMTEGLRVPARLPEAGFEEYRAAIESRLRDASCEATKSP